jgi:uncharacterized protein YndB with AHSA1/START domain
MTNITATAETDIQAPPARVWQALTDPAEIQQYMFGSVVETDWKPGSPIVWKGEYEGKTYEDRGKIIAVEPEHRLVVTHFSPMSGQDDAPENYHRLTYELARRGGTTHLLLSQDGNTSQDEADRNTQNWSTMLDGLKKVVEA